jgi:hypothetical protein
MRCPHCAGEILDGSRFCGICGRRLAAATIPADPAAAGPAAGSGRPVAGANSSAARAAGGGELEPSGQVRAAAPGKPRAELIPVSESVVAPIELPVSRGARWARILAVLALDVALAGGGVAMIVSFARDCEGVRATSMGAPAADARARAADTPEDRP